MSQGSILDAIKNTLNSIRGAGGVVGEAGSDRMSSSSSSSSPRPRSPSETIDTTRRTTQYLSTNKSIFSRLSPTFVALTILSLSCSISVYLSHVDSLPSYPPGSLSPEAKGGGAGSCKQSWMSPSYLRIAGTSVPLFTLRSKRVPQAHQRFFVTPPFASPMNDPTGFGREYSRLGAGPWGMYLYREQGWDDDPIVQEGHYGAASNDGSGKVLSLTGTPVVFVPGNAGSFRQVRSLASAASRAYYELPGVRRKGVGSKEGGKPLDFFTLDFNDDFSAFHGQTLLDQAEYLADSIRYILSLYHQNSNERHERPDPSSCIVVAHSMGGIVARAAMLHPHYQSGSISTLITIATPHAAPPATIDRGIDRVYDQINAYWRTGYNLESTHKPPSREDLHAQAELENLVLISLSGGISDTTVASETASLASIMPLNDSYGFTVFTTAIPGVQTPIDHLAMLWCRQLMETLAHAMLSIVDTRVSQGVIPRQERVKKLAERLLGPVESSPNKLEGRKVTLDTLERGVPSQEMLVGERLTIRNHGQDRSSFVLPIPRHKTFDSSLVFSLITSASIGRAVESLVEVYACSATSGDSSPSCMPLFPTHVTPLPLSPHSAIPPILPAPVEDGSMGFVTIDADQLEGMDQIVIVVKPGETWLVAEFGDKDKRVHTVDKSALQLMFSPFKLDAFPKTPSLVSELWLPALDSSLLTFKMRVFRSECQDALTLFAPLLRQYSPLLHESKYFPSVRQASLYTHSSGPFLPLPASPFISSGARLQLILDPTCHRENSGAPGDVALEIKLDLWGSLGNLATRYRMAVIAFPFAIVVLVFARQLKEYNLGHSFMPFAGALNGFAKYHLLPLLGIITVLSVVQSVLLSTHTSFSQSNLGSEDQHHRMYASLPPRWISEMLLGNQNLFFALLGAFVVFTLLSVVVFEFLVLHLLVTLSAMSARLLGTHGPAFIKPFVQLSEPRETMPAQRIITMSALLLLVLFFAPYQFAFLVIFLVHFVSTVRFLRLTEEASSSPTTPASTRRVWDRYHYSFAVLMVMMTLLPINAMILAVWVRNLAVGWLAPFSTDHNVLTIIGFLLNVEALHSGKMLQRTPGKIASNVTLSLSTIIAAFSLLYGIRWTHNIFPLSNALFLWLSANTSNHLVGALQDVVGRGKRKLSTSVVQTDEGGSGAPTGKRIV